MCSVSPVTCVCVLRKIKIQNTYKTTKKPVSEFKCILGIWSTCMISVFGWYDVFSGSLCVFLIAWLKMYTIFTGFVIFKPSYGTNTQMMQFCFELWFFFIFVVYK